MEDIFKYYTSTHVRANGACRHDKYRRGQRMGVALNFNFLLVGRRIKWRRLVMVEILQVLGLAQ